VVAVRSAALVRERLLVGWSRFGSGPACLLNPRGTKKILGGKRLRVTVRKLLKLLFSNCELDKVNLTTNPTRTTSALAQPRHDPDARPFMDQKKKIPV
jgi:hypothetical protein